MKHRNRLFLVLATALFLVHSPACLAASKLIMAHYMPWFQAPYTLGPGNWGEHWTLTNFTSGAPGTNPNLINPTNSEREIASWYYPQIGPYDSLDPAVLEYHVVLMKLGGIDGVIMYWTGNDDYCNYAQNEERTKAMFSYIQKAGLQFVLCYQDDIIQDEINGNCGASGVTTNNAIAHAQQTMLYAQTNYFDNPHYARWNGQPVFLDFGPQYFQYSSNWVNLFSVLEPSNQPAFFTENYHYRCTNNIAGAFDWTPMANAVDGVLTQGLLDEYITNFDAQSQSYPGYISGGFPRFNSYYAQEGGTGQSTNILYNNNGQIFVDTLGRAMTDSSVMIQLQTWNDFGEGTIIEPTVQYGYRDLGVVQDFRRQYLDPTFAGTTNDLTLAFRLYNQRETNALNPVTSAELDRVFTNLISGDLATAGLQLTGMETLKPVIYNVTVTNSQFGFTLGGYLSTNGVRIQATTNLATAAWQTLTTLAAGTSKMTYSAALPPQGASAFFQLQNAGP